MSNDNLTVNGTLLVSEGATARSTLFVNSFARLGACAVQGPLSVSGQGIMLYDVENTSGSLAQPSYTFSSDLDTGLCNETPDTLTLVAGAQASLVACSGGNVSLAGTLPSDFGSSTSGQNVVFVGEASIVPDGVPNSGMGGVFFVEAGLPQWLCSKGWS